MKSLILALATALPQYSADQSDIAKKIINIFKLEKKSAQFIENLYNKTQIKRRYCVLKDVENNGCEDGVFFNKEFMQHIPGTEQRNEIYIKEAPKLAIQAAKEAINNWGRDPKEITHIISVSCTGVMAPGIEFILQQEFNLPEQTQRIGINFMGCFGAFRALAVASAIAQENPKNRILIVCTELCSLHFQVSHVPEILIGNALFADGSSAAIIGADAREQENPLWTIEKSASFAIANSKDKMTWKISDHGCVMSLNRDVPNIIEENSKKIAETFLNTNKFSDLIWAIHPGGKSIVQAIEHSCNLEKEQTQASWNVLENYGNMSSSTFLFVLKELEKNNKQNSKVIGLGFGPGLSVEAILLDNAN